MIYRKKTMTISLLLLNCIMPDIIASPLNNCLIDFDSSMNAKKLSYYRKYDEGYNKEAIAKLKVLYEHNHFLRLERSKDVKIPKIIHQIWVGSKPIPKVLIILAKTWKAFHPGFEYKLWTNDLVEELLPRFSDEHRELYLNAQDPRGKADILRYYLLYWYGGLYVDADIRCLGSFVELHHYYDFYVGITCNRSFVKEELINNAVIASSPGHSIMKCLLDNLKHNSSNDWMKIYGVLYFSRIVFDALFSSAGINIALPMNIFYPLDGSKAYLQKEYPRSLCVHYWASGSNPDWKIDKW